MAQAARSVSVVERLVGQVEAHGLAVEEDFLPAASVAALRARARSLDTNGALRAAGVGRAAGRAFDPALRGDRIGWLEPDRAVSAERELLAALERVRLLMNRGLGLGLFEVEAHYAIYPPGARYAAHRDRFRDDDARVLSCVLYLNEEWRPADGGALRLHLDEGVAHDVLPVGGTLVTFLSARFLHEVLPATRERVSIAGWFRRRAGPDC